MIFKQHKLIWLIFSILSLIAIIVALIVGFTTEMWSIMFVSLLTLPLIGIGWFIKFFNTNYLLKLSEQREKIQKIKRLSFLISFVYVFFFFLPIFIWLIVSFVVNKSILDPFMLISLYFSLIIGYYIGYYFENKKLQAKPNQTS